MEATLECDISASKRSYSKLLVPSYIYVFQRIDFWRKKTHPTTLSCQTLLSKMSRSQFSLTFFMRKGEAAQNYRLILSRWEARELNFGCQNKIQPEDKLIWNYSFEMSDFIYGVSAEIIKSDIWWNFGFRALQTPPYAPTKHRNVLQTHFHHPRILGGCHLPPWKCQTLL